MNKDKLLYFPYIDVPYNDWSIRCLLYWDEISAIVPTDFIDNPNLYAPEMRKLVDLKMVRPIRPNQFIDPENFSEPFIKFIQKLKKEGRLRLLGQNYVDVHIDKFGYVIEEFLFKEGLLRRAYPWCQVETFTANLFMAYLALYISIEGDNTLLPMTDSSVKANVFRYNYPMGNQNKLSSSEEIRVGILNDLFPVPNGEINIYDLLSFKDRYGNLAKKFRKDLEVELERVSFIKNKEERDWNANQLRTNYNDTIEELTAKMKENRWHKISLGTLVSVGSSIATEAIDLLGLDIPGASVTATGLLGTVFDLIKNKKEKKKEVLKSPLAYAFYARKAFGKG